VTLLTPAACCGFRHSPPGVVNVWAGAAIAGALGPKRRNKRPIS